MNGPPEPNVLDWDQVKGVAQEAFDVWVSGGELHWAQEVWTKTVAAGMANYSDEIDPNFARAERSEMLFPRRTHSGWPQRLLHAGHKILISLYIDLARVHRIPSNLKMPRESSQLIR